MGNSVAAKTLKDLTADQLAGFCESLGSDYKAYAETILKEGINGNFIASTSDEEIRTQLENDFLGVKSSLHREKILAEIVKLKTSFSDKNKEAQPRESSN